MASRNETDAVVNVAATAQTPEGSQRPQEAPGEARTSNTPDSTPQGRTGEPSGLPEASEAARLPADREAEIRKHVADTTNWSLGNLAARDLLAELDRVREQHKASLRHADAINNQLMEEVQRYAIGEERPVLWSVYNRMHVRAATAEAKLGRIARLVRRLAAHAAGFQDVLDDSDRGPWAKTVGADIDELRRLADEEPQP